jgi:hypothetical protein
MSGEKSTIKTKKHFKGEFDSFESLELSIFPKIG